MRRLSNGQTVTTKLIHFIKYNYKVLQNIQFFRIMKKIILSLTENDIEIIILMTNVGENTMYCQHKHLINISFTIQILDITILYLSIKSNVVTNNT